MKRNINLFRIVSSKAFQPPLTRKKDTLFMLEVDQANETERRVFALYHRTQVDRIIELIN